MIKVKHPVEDCNIGQEKFLTSCPQEERLWHELLFAYGNITYKYHSEARRSKPTEKDYHEWLEGLPEKHQKRYERTEI